MKKQAENQPLDDLFARKLGNMSLDPSPNGFNQLQARLGQSNTTTRTVFWRNPIIQRYMLAAACLVLVFLIGWFYQASNTTSPIRKSQSIANQAEDQSKSSVGGDADYRVDKTASDVALANESNSESAKSQSVVTTKAAALNLQQQRRAKVAYQLVKGNIKQKPEVVSEPPILIQLQAESKTVKPTLPTESVALSTSSSTPERLTESSVKQLPTAERVLVVTIAEPEALAEARQLAKTTYQEKPVVAIDTKPEKETRTGSLWQQVKRIKQGDVFARRDAPKNEDRGLLGRAYSGIKQSFEKDKSAK